MYIPGEYLVKRLAHTRKTLACLRIEFATLSALCNVTAQEVEGFAKQELDQAVQLEKRFAAKKASAKKGKHSVAFSSFVCRYLSDLPIQIILRDSTVSSH